MQQPYHLLTADQTAAREEALVAVNSQLHGQKGYMTNSEAGI
jgi:hypothetical protein